MEWNLSLYSRGSPCYSSRRLRTSPPWTLAPPAPLPEAQGLVRPPSSAVVCVGGSLPTPSSTRQTPGGPRRPPAAGSARGRDFNLETRQRGAGQMLGARRGNRDPQGPRLGGAARSAQYTPTRPSAGFSPVSRGTAPTPHPRPAPGAGLTGVVTRPRVPEGPPQTT